MKKTILLFACFLCSFAGSFAQINQKLVFPNPQNAETSFGQFLNPSADGGYILAGTGVNNAMGNYAIPRLIKLSASLQVQWDKSYLEPSPPNGMTASLHSGAFQTPDGGYALLVNNDTSSTDFLKLDANGDVLWEKDLFPWSYHNKLLGVLPDGGFVLTNKMAPYDLIRLDAAGNIITQKTLVNSASNGNITSVLLSNNDVLTAYLFNNTQSIFLRTDADGNTIWQAALDNTPWLSPNLGLTTLAAMPDGGFIFLTYESGTVIKRIQRYDSNGVKIWQSPDNTIPATLQLQHIAANAQGRILVSGQTIANRGFVAMLNVAGDGIEWSAESPDDGQEHLTNLNAIASADGWAAGVGKTTGDKFGFMKVGVNSGITINLLSGRVAKDNDENCVADLAESGLAHARVIANNGTESLGAFTNSNGEYQLALPAGSYSLSVQPNELFFFLCPAANAAVDFPAGNSGTAELDLPMQAAELIHEISGEVRLDQNSDCITDPNDAVLSNWNLELTAGTGTMHLITDEDGKYKVFVPDGDYHINLDPLNNHFQVCAPNFVPVSFSGGIPQTEQIDFSVTPEFICAKMRAELSSSAIRPCTTAVVYANYKNDGTATAVGATLTLNLDPLLTYVSANPAPSIVDGQTLTFDLGDVPASPGGAWISIPVQVNTSCALVSGDQVCADATVQPNEDCTQDPNWSGAIIQVSGTCQNNNQAIFIITNVGNANSSMLDYIITEDQIVLFQEPFQLNQGQSIQRAVPGNGLPLTIIADQEPGYPGDTSVVWNILNCGGNGNGQSSGFGGSSGPFNHQECFFVTNSFDPNDKDATPLGYGPEHYVHPGTPLEYRIRFQNTGTDTAFLVVIRDTLSSFLDAGKIEARSASHPFKMALINGNILQFTFQNILLPDSTTNKEASQGFVEFEVYPVADLPKGTEVLNNAAIYFDFNEPVITNTVKRVYGEYVMVAINDPVGPATLPVKVFPNPFVSAATFELPVEGDYQLLLMDEAGRELKTIAFSGASCLLQRDQLPAGALLWSIRSNGVQVASGSLIAH